jgi:malonyl-CoA O-methyltransferase
MINRQTVKRHFSKSAHTYNASAVMQQEVAERLAERLPLFKMTPERIIDLGAGTGFLSQHIRSFYPNSQLTLVDLSLPMLQQSRQHPSLSPQSGWRKWLGMEQAQKVHFINADAYHLPFADQSVDMLVSSLMLQWCDDLDKVLAECHRVLKPEGLLYIASLGPDTLTEIRQAWKQVDGDEVPHVSPFIDMHDLGDALSRIGFMNGVLDTEHIQLTYTDAMKAIKDLKEIGATNATQQAVGLTGKQRWAKFLSAYNAQTNAEGRVSATFEVIYAHAWAGTSYHNTNHSGIAEIPVSAIRRWQK